MLTHSRLASNGDHSHGCGHHQRWAVCQALILTEAPGRSTSGGFPLGSEETKLYGDEVTSIAWPEMAELGLDHTVSNYRSSLSWGLRVPLKLDTMDPWYHHTWVNFSRRPGVQTEVELLGRVQFGVLPGRCVTRTVSEGHWQELD